MKDKILEEIEAIAKAEGECPIEAADNYSHYFLGSIVISKKDETNERYIVDGQQRLTTLTLLLINLSRMSDNTADKSDIGKLIFSEECRDYDIC